VPEMMEACRVLPRLPLSSVWVFLSDICNLRCRYCFFKYRTHARKLEVKRLRPLFSLLPAHKRVDVVISGGEPLLTWAAAKELVLTARAFLRRPAFILESNGILLDKGKIAFLKQHRVKVELGVDGGYETTSRFRRGLTRDAFARMVRNIAALRSAGIELSPTMTVHPESAAGMFEDFRYLVSLGLYAIDVHPALFEAWDEGSAAEFVRGYRRIASFALRCDRRVLNPSYSRPLPLSLDLIVEPGGDILPNWVYLCVPQEVRQEYYYGRVGAQGVEFFPEKLRFILGHYRRWFRRPVSYGEVSNLNLQLLSRVHGKGVLFPGVDAYLRIWKTMKKLDALLTDA
jgi:MoaA/NifB/PqqE/SkfB family radical SAM enzyme